MKRLLCVILCATLLFSFAGCSEKQVASVAQPPVSESSAPQTDTESSVPQIQNTPTDVLTADEAHMLDAIDKSSGQVYDIEKKIWEYREPGMQEFQSSTLLMDMLEAEGFAVQRGVKGKDLVNGVDIDVPTGFVATYEGTGKGATVALLMEYDALPNGHACGHNLIAGACYAAAMGIKEALKTMPGTLKVYGCPAEETTVMKQYFYDAGLFDGVDVAYSPHGGSEWTTYLRAKAASTTKITFNGKASHAAAAPWDGRSALDAIMLASMGFEFMREHIYDSDIIHYYVSNGGQASNVVPEMATLDIVIRSDDSSHLDELLERAENIFKGAELMTGTKAEYKWDTPRLAPIPAPRLMEQAALAGAAVGIKKERINATPSPDGATDVGNVAYKIPTAFVWFPTAEDQPALHTDEHVAAVNTDFARENSILAGKLMALSAVRLMTDQAELDAIKNEFSVNSNK